MREIMACGRLKREDVNPEKKTKAGLN